MQFLICIWCDCDLYVTLPIQLFVSALLTETLLCHFSLALTILMTLWIEWNILYYYQSLLKINIALIEVHISIWYKPFSPLNAPSSMSLILLSQIFRSCNEVSPTNQLAFIASRSLELRTSWSSLRSPMKKEILKLP